MIKLISLFLAILPGVVIAQDAEHGRSLFLSHCATCHGLDGTGQGPMAGTLLIKPANLLELSALNGGMFPLERVVRRIDGRDPLVSHGSPMPVYGPYFEAVANVAMKVPTGQPFFASQPVADIIVYLQSIQEGD